MVGKKNFLYIEKFQGKGLGPLSIRPWVKKRDISHEDIKAKNEVCDIK